MPRVRPICKHIISNDLRRRLIPGAGPAFALLPLVAAAEGMTMMDMISDRDVFDLAQLGPLFGREGDRASLVRLLRKAESLGYTTFIAAMEWEALRREH